MLSNFFFCFVCTLGILAGMWPCGIVTFIHELFIAESKSQVYDHLHNFLLKNEGAASSLSKFSNCVHIDKSVNVILEYISDDDG